MEIVEGGTNYNTGDRSKRIKEFNDYPAKKIKNEVLSKTCIEELEIHSAKANEKQEKVKEKYQCSTCGKLMASGWV